MGAPGVRDEPVETDSRVDEGDVADGVDLAVDDECPQVTGRFLDAVADGDGSGELGTDRGECQALLDGPARSAKIDW